MSHSNEVTERIVRDSYGRLVSFLAARWGDLMAAEDALGEALLLALAQWPEKGVPDNPEGWLLTVAQRRLVDLSRHGAVAEKALGTFKIAAELAQNQPMQTEFSFPDERLKLLFTCAHPALDPALHTPLMLQTVLGLNAAKIGAAFLVAPTTMGQRLVRAKAKIRDAKIPFEIPGVEELPQRLTAVLQAIYAAFQTGWEDVAGADTQHGDLATEAIWLGRTLLALLPDEPEARGLLALMLYCEARRPARREGTRYVPLYQQDSSRWSRPLLQEAEQLLRQAAVGKEIGRFQLEAAIQSAHTSSILTNTPDWEGIAQLYDGLVRFSPTVGAMVGWAAAQASAYGPQAGLDLLARLESATTTVADYQPFWALTAHLHARLEQAALARRAYERAIGLTEDEATRRYLWQQAALLPPD